MKTIALVGPYNSKTRETLHGSVPDGFRMIDVPSCGEYAMLKDADYIIIRTIRLTKADVQDAPNLKYVQKWGAGYDAIDVKGLGELGIPVGICNGINAEPVAELAVMLMLSLYRWLIVHNEKLKKGIWTKDQYSSKSYMIRGKTVGIIGLGNIGSKVARIIKGFGADVIYTDILPKQKVRDALGIQEVSLDTLLKTSDIISIHVPLCDQTRHMMNGEAFSKMKPSAIFINSARGELVDEGALLDALQTGKIAGAGLDALPKEPPDADWPFYALENVVLTPHTGGNTADNDRNMICRCMENILTMENGGKLRTRDLVNNQFLPVKLETKEDDL